MRELPKGGRVMRRSAGARAASILALLGLFGAAWFAAHAGAAPSRYVFEQCDSALPNGGIQGATFAGYAGGPYKPSNTCAENGGGLAIAQVANSNTVSYWTVPGAVPPGGRMESITITATVCNGGQPNVVAFAFRQDWPGSCHEEVRTYREESSQPLDFYVWLGCAAPSPACTGTPSILARYFAVTEVDPVAPRVADLGGSLLGPGTVRGRQAVTATASDVGGGVASAVLLVNGLPAAPPRTTVCQVAEVNNPSVVGLVALKVTPCPTTVGVGWTIDTSGYPFHDGSNSVQVCATDFSTLSDANSGCSERRTIEVDNSCGESTVPEGRTLTAQFAGSRRDSITVGFGKTGKITGRLLGDSGAPVGGAILCVKSEVEGGAGGAGSMGSVATDATGRFTYEVPAGPNRRITIGYRHDSLQISRQLRFYSRVRARLNASPRSLSNRERVHFRGQLPGPGEGGRVVILQANVVGSKRWLTFRRATTGPRGGFRADYHFVATQRRTRYRFRAVVPSQSDYPWAAGQSPPVKVLVKP